jgi:hypothetical protein
MPRTVDPAWAWDLRPAAAAEAGETLTSPRGVHYGTAARVPIHLWSS